MKEHLSAVIEKITKRKNTENFMENGDRELWTVEKY